MNDIIEQYLAHVRRNLYHLVPDSDFLSDLRTNLEEYLQEFPDSTYQDLEERFGKPEDVAAEFIRSQNPDTPKNQARHRKKIRLFAILSCAIIVFLLCFIIALSGNRQAYFSDETKIIPTTEVYSE